MKVKKLLSTIAMASVLVACGPSGSQGNDDVIKIGFIGPLTGDASNYGISEKNALEIAVKEYENESGKDIEVIYMDDKADATEAVTAYYKLVEEDEVSAIIGPVTSGSGIAVADASQSYMTPIISPSASADLFTKTEDGEVRENVFRVCTADPFAGSYMGDLAKEEFNYSKVAVLYNNGSDYSVGLKDAFIESCEENGIDVVYNESYPAGTTDFKSYISKIKSADVDAIYLPDYYQEVATIMKQIRDASITIPCLGGDGWYGVLSVEGIDASIFDGSYFVSPFNAAGEDELTKSFVSEYKELYGSEPDMFAALTYDTAMSLFDALETAESLEVEDVIAALEKTDYKDGLTGSYTFDEYHTPVKDLLVITFEDGNYKAK